jgi:hypothetical protein
MRSSCPHGTSTLRVFEDGVPMKGTECYQAGGNVWRALYSTFGNKQREVVVFGRELNAWGYRNHLGRCYYVRNLDRAKEIWKEEKARMKKDEAQKKEKLRERLQKKRGGSQKGKEVVRPPGG